MTNPDIASAPGLLPFQLTAGRRALRLILDDTGAGRDVLLPQRVVGSEAVCGGFEFQVLCVSESATLALKNFIGATCELQIVTDRGQLRRICGIVTSAASGQSDGGLGTYKLVIRDALSVMESRVNTRVFRDKNELEIIQVLVTEWQTSNPVLARTFGFHVDEILNNRGFPRHGYTMQNNDSDAEFARRLMQRRGIAWFFRPGMPTVPHSPAGSGPATTGHTLVLFDDANRLQQSAAGSIRFHRDAATEQRDAITGWSAVRQFCPGNLSLHSWDYLQPGGAAFMRADAPTRIDQGERGNQLAAGIEDYRVAAPHLGGSPQDLNALSDVQMAYLEYASKTFHGEGGVRDLAVGEWFSLEGHHDIDTHRDKDRQFVVTSQRIVAENNLPTELGARVGRLFAQSGWDAGAHPSNADSGPDPIRYRTSFSCVRRGVRIVAPPPAPLRPQVQSALVVGPENEVVWCDRLGRVKVRFPATRPQDHAHAGGAGSADHDGDSAWVRVASSWAGNGQGSSAQCGARMLPPVGAEVLVAFAGGDPDKPVIVAQVYNGAAPPPEFRSEDALPANRYQSGIRSREIRGARGNQLRLDDTPGQISAQLASDHASTELNLGFLTEPRRRDRATPRGEGAELRTDEAIALHATRGILLSAWKLLGGAGAKGGQLARDDYLNLLRECGELCASLGDYASRHNGLATDTKEQDALLDRFKKWEDGSNTKPESPEPREPVIAVTSPAGIGFASSRAIVSYSASTVDTVAQQHLQLTSGQRFSVNAGKGVSLFAHHGGLHAIAHKGRLLLQSQHDDTAINSAKNMQLTATEGTVTVSGKVILLVAEDGSFLKLGDGPPVLGSKQPLKFNAQEFIYDKPQSMSAQMPSFEGGKADQQFVVRFPPGVADEQGDVPIGAVVADAKLDIALSDGSRLSASSDESGKVQAIERDAMHLADIILHTGGDNQGNGNV